ncbi:corrinoid protein [Pleomorphomonas sp. JP5]|uniref:corrinoid protein n=1 Tax=Pleomorphomonas sp. JP5 TaxID=2942998 RepID=UPI002043E2C3|nr:corrinoid protein [Pleomorphomonas sp. JP5]MCM5559350.1 corrinoid protein [Pleomorphomonas sp. JP5]
MQDWSKLYDAIVDGDDKTSAKLTKEAIEAGEDPSTLISETMVPAMAEVGRLFEIEEYFVPELLLAGRAMKAGLELLRPILAASGVEPTGRIVIGTVKGDLHDIGKNLVVSMMEGAGFEVIDLGIDVPPETFIEAVRDKKPQIVGMSALLTVTMPAIKTTIEAMVAAGVRDGVKIMVGGAPVTEEYAREVGADAFGENASVAATIAKRLCAEAKAA